MKFSLLIGEFNWITSQLVFTTLKQWDFCCQTCNRFYDKLLPESTVLTLENLGTLTPRSFRITFVRPITNDKTLTLAKICRQNIHWPNASWWYWYCQSEKNLKNCGHRRMLGFVQLFGSVSLTQAASSTWLHQFLQEEMVGCDLV